MQNTLKLGPNFDYAGFMKLPADQKTAFLTQAESDRVIKTKLSGYDKRAATAADVAFINENAKKLNGDGSITPIKEGDLIYIEKKIDNISKYQRNQSDQSGKNILNKEKWEGFKKSGYRKGDYLYTWDNQQGAFIEYKLSTIDGRETKAKTGNTARSPQDMGNLTNQNWDNYRGFEPAVPEELNNLNTDTDS